MNNKESRSSAPSLRGANFMSHQLLASGVDEDGNDWFTMSYGKQIVVEDPEKAVDVAQAIVVHNYAESLYQADSTGLNGNFVVSSDAKLPQQLQAHQQNNV